MNRTFALTLAAAFLAAAAPADALAQLGPKAKDGKVIGATDEQYRLLSKYTEMVGTIQGTAPGMITLRVQYDHPKTGNAGAAQAGGPGGPTAAQQQQMQRLQNEMASAGRITNPAQRQQRMAQIQNQMAQLQAQVQQGGKQAGKTPALVKEYIDFDLPLIDKAVIRKSKLGVEYDEKGNIKEAPAEKEKGQVGYPAKFEDLTRGDEVKVYFAKAEAAKTIIPKKDADGAFMDLPANRPRIRLVVIINDVDGAAMPNKKKNK